MTLGEKLHMLLNERELTQKQFAVDLHIAPSTIGGYMQDTSEPDFATVKQMAAYLGVSTDYLLDFPSALSEDNNIQELLRIFHSLSDDQKEIYIEQGKVFLKVNAKRK